MIVSWEGRISCFFFPDEWKLPENSWMSRGENSHWLKGVWLPLIGLKRSDSRNTRKKSHAHLDLYYIHILGKASSAPSSGLIEGLRQDQSAANTNRVMEVEV